jgi:cobaltochelatase CobN
MLEAVRKEYWKPSEQVRRTLAVEYAKSVVGQGIACCENTCGNPFLNRMVEGIISAPGVMNPETAKRFRPTVERATRKAIEDQARSDREVHGKVLDRFDTNAPSEKIRDRDKASTGPADKEVEGYKMEEMRPEEQASRLPSSRAQWYALAFIMVILVPAVLGLIRRNYRER